MIVQDAIVQELERILPENHVFFEKLESMTKSTQSRDDNDLVEALTSTFEIIDDWKRGIRDWSEVEDVFDRARAELAYFKETT